MRLPVNEETTSNERMYNLANWPTSEEAMVFGFRSPHNAVMDEDRWLMAVKTGEYRKVKKGEWYLKGSVLEAYCGTGGQQREHSIARLVAVHQVPTYVIEEEKEKSLPVHDEVGNSIGRVIETTSCSVVVRLDESPEADAVHRKILDTPCVSMSCKTELPSAEDRAQKAEILLGKIFQWTTEFGEALCPTVGCPDTFGEGIQEAKAQIARLFRKEPLS